MLTLIRKRNHYTELCKLKFEKAIMNLEDEANATWNSLNSDGPFFSPSLEGITMMGTETYSHPAIPWL